MGEGAHNFLGARSESVTVHAPDEDREYDPSWINIGYDPKYDGQMLMNAAAAPPPKGELVTWNPVERRAAWRVAHPVSQSGGVLAMAGNLVVQGRPDGMLAAYRASGGTELWEFDSGTGIMAPPGRSGGQVLVRSVDGYHDLSSSMSCFQVLDRRLDLAQRVTPVDDRCHLSGLHEIAQGGQVLLVQLRHEHVHVLAHES